MQQKKIRFFSTILFIFQEAKIMEVGCDEQSEDIRKNIYLYN